METQEVVRIVGVSKHFGEHNVQALDNVSLAIAEGEFVALMGPSGCGKSTLLNCVGGIEPVTGGQILIGGKDIAKLSEAALTELRRDKIGFVFQFFNLLSTLTVRENVELPLDLAGGGKRDDNRRSANDLIALVGLEGRENFYPSQLSGGEMQRAAIARAVVHKPQIVLADEPTGNLDTGNGDRILTLLSSFCKERRATILMATHSAEAASRADRVVEMKDGRIVAPVSKRS